MADNTEEKKVKPSQQPAVSPTNSSPTNVPDHCVLISYHSLLNQVCDAHCGQPLVSGAGPEFTTRLIAFDMSTKKWYHTRCFPSFQPDNWSHHIKSIMEKSRWRERDADQQRNCENAVLHWAFLEQLTNGKKDLQVVCNPWTTALPPKHMDCFALEFGMNYAERSLYPDCLFVHRPGQPIQMYVDTMFPPAFWTQWRAVWKTRLAVKPHELDDLAELIKSRVGHIDEIGAQICVNVEFYRRTAPLPNVVANEAKNEPEEVWLVAHFKAVEGSQLFYQPLVILSEGNMKSKLPEVDRELGNLENEVGAIVESVLKAWRKAHPEIRGHDQWECKAQHCRVSCRASASGAPTLWVGMCAPSAALAPRPDERMAYVEVGDHSLAELTIVCEELGCSPMIPWRVASGAHLSPKLLEGAKEIQITPLYCPSKANSHVSLRK